MSRTNAAPRSVIVAVVVALVLMPVGGCGRTGVSKRLGRVTGKVTLGGQPVADALVMFSPVTAGSPSAGRTDSAGTYTLVFTKGVNGAEVGEHTVMITTYQPAGEDPPTPEVPEKVPLKYREGPGVPKAEVKAGKNTFDFALEPGPVEAPQPKTKGKAKAGGKLPCY